MTEQATEQFDRDKYLDGLTLSPAELELRDRFVQEYMVDCDTFRAAIRCGAKAPFALEIGTQLYSDVYVQRRLVDERRNVARIKQEEAKAAHIENMRQLSLTGPESSRVQAGKHYAELNGWTKPDTTQDAAQDLIEAFKDLAPRLPV